MSTAAQTAANQANAQKSSGPKTEEGKAASSQNNLRFGLAGSFRLLHSENPDDYKALTAALCFEHQPQTQFELILVEKMSQHFWVAQRAMRLQDQHIEDPKQLALFLRYQTTHDRAFHKGAAELRTLRNDKLKQQIGFESHERKQSVEKRKQDTHDLDLLLAEAKLDHQILLNMNIQTPENKLPVDLHRHIRVQKAA